jgi:hypothetical protein
MANVERSITDGPGKWDLMLAIFEKKEVSFKIQKGDSRMSIVHPRMRIRSILLEDGSGDSFFLGLYDAHKRCFFVCYYHTITRTGHIIENRDIDFVKKNIR